MLSFTKPIATPSLIVNYTPRYIVLDNGLRALLISDTRTSSADNTSDGEDEEEEEDEDDKKESEDEGEKEGKRRRGKPSEKQVHNRDLLSGSAQ